MSDQYLRHRRGGRGFYEEIPSDIDEDYEDEEEPEVDPLEHEHLEEMGDFELDEIPGDEVPDLEEIPPGNPFDPDDFPHLRDDLELLAFPEPIQGRFIINYS